MEKFVYFIILLSLLGCTPPIKKVDSFSPPKIQLEEIQPTSEKAILSVLIPLNERTNVDHCKWIRVFCVDGHVIHLNLSGLGLTTDKFISKLTNLTELDLSHNDLTSFSAVNFQNLLSRPYFKLNLSYNHIAEFSLAPIKPSYGRLLLDHNPLSEWADDLQNIVLPIVKICKNSVPKNIDSLRVSKWIIIDCTADQTGQNDLYNKRRPHHALREQQAIAMNDLYKMHGRIPFNGEVCYWPGVHCNQWGLIEDLFFPEASGGNTTSGFPQTLISLSRLSGSDGLEKIRFVFNNDKIPEFIFSTSFPEGLYVRSLRNLSLREIQAMNSPQIEWEISANANLEQLPFITATSTLCSIVDYGNSYIEFESGSALLQVKHLPALNNIGFIYTHKEFWKGCDPFFNRRSFILDEIRTKKPAYLSESGNMIDVPDQLFIQGHADEKGTNSVNLVLSLERAEAVKAYLMGNYEGWLKQYLKKHRRQKKPLPLPSPKYPVDKVKIYTLGLGKECKQIDENRFHASKSGRIAFLNSGIFSPIFYFYTTEGRDGLPIIQFSKDHDNTPKCNSELFISTKDEVDNTVKEYFKIYHPDTHIQIQKQNRKILRQKAKTSL